MSEFQVINGTVEYEHNKPGPEDYEKRVPKVSLTFTVAEGSNPAVVVEKVMAMAVATVEVVLGARRITNQAGEPITGSDEMPGPTPREPVQQKPGRKKADPPTVPAASAPIPEDAALVSDTVLEASPEVDPAAVVDDDDLGIDSAPVEAAEITDEDLQKVVQPLSAKMRAKVGNINALRELIAKANEGTDGKTLQAIPQPARADFVTNCKALNATIV